MPISYSTVVAAAAIGIIPVFGWGWFVVRKGHLAVMDWNLFLKIIFWGVLTAIPASAIEILLIESGGDSQIVEGAQKLWFWGSPGLFATGLLSAGLMALVEEISKGSGIMIILRKKGKIGISEGMICGALVGLAFGITENGVYFAKAISSETQEGFLAVIVLRFLLSTSAHIIYSGLMGTILAKMFQEEGIGKKLSFLILAFLSPVFVHALFNFILGTELSLLVAVIIVAGFCGLGLILHLSQETSNQAGAKASVSKISSSDE